jgi:hypothetical protein
MLLITFVPYASGMPKAPSFHHSVIGALFQIHATAIFSGLGEHRSIELTKFPRNEGCDARRNIGGQSKELLKNAIAFERAIGMKEWGVVHSRK